MVKVVCIRFKNAGRVYYFDPGELDIKRGQHVIVETIRGVEYGLVVDGVKEVSDEEIKQIIVSSNAEVSAKNMRQLMEIVRTKFPQASGKQISNVVKSLTT